MQPEPQAEHRWLQRMIGEWRYESEGEADPGDPAMRDTGTETVRALGDVWVMCEARSEAPSGGSSQWVMTVGFDPTKKRFVGTFIGSMMAFLWLYEGSLDAAGNALALESEGPSFAEEGKMAKYRDVMELRGDDERVFTSHYQTADGTWHPFMTTRYQRIR